MNSLIKKVSYLAIMFIIANMVSGCGEEREDNIPAVKLTSSAVVSEPAADGHGHNVEIPFTDISSIPADLFQYRSSDNTGHSHVIALSKEQIIDLNNGLRLTVVSSTQSSGTVHTHTWNIWGGNVLYDKNCYNCHSNDKRGQDQNRMELKLRPLSNVNQINSIINPSATLLSTSTQATPVATYVPVFTAPNGVQLVASLCSGCHVTPKNNFTATQIRTAIYTFNEMNSLNYLSDAQLEAIAVSLKK